MMMMLLLCWILFKVLGTLLSEIGIIFHLETTGVLIMGRTILLLFLLFLRNMCLCVCVVGALQEMTMTLTSGV